MLVRTTTLRCATKVTTAHTAPCCPPPQSAVPRDLNLTPLHHTADHPVPTFAGPNQAQGKLHPLGLLACWSKLTVGSCSLLTQDRVSTASAAAHSTAMNCPVKSAVSTPAAARTATRRTLAAHPSAAFCATPHPAHPHTAKTHYLCRRPAVAEATAREVRKRCELHSSTLCGSLRTVKNTCVTLPSRARPAAPLWLSSSLRRRGRSCRR